MKQYFWVFSLLFRKRTTNRIIGRDKNKKKCKLRIAQYRSNYTKNTFNLHGITCQKYFKSPCSWKTAVYSCNSKINFILCTCLITQKEKKTKKKKFWVFSIFQIMFYFKKQRFALLSSFLTYLFEHFFLCTNTKSSKSFERFTFYLHFRFRTCRAINVDRNGRLNFIFNFRLPQHTLQKPLNQHRHPQPHVK